MREIVFYQTRPGRSPVQDYLATLSARQARRIWDVLDAVRTFEHVPAVYLKKLAGTDGLWEVRVSAGRDAFRLLCFFDGMNVVVVLTGFAKKTGKGAAPGNPGGLPAEAGLPQPQAIEWWMILTACSRSTPPIRNSSKHLSAGIRRSNWA